MPCSIPLLQPSTHFACLQVEADGSVLCMPLQVHHWRQHALPLSLTTQHGQTNGNNGQQGIKVLLFKVGQSLQFTSTPISLHSVYVCVCVCVCVCMCVCMCVGGVCVCVGGGVHLLQLYLNPCLHSVLAFFFFFSFFLTCIFLMLITFPPRRTLCDNYTLLVQHFEPQGRRFTNFHYY